MNHIRNEEKNALNVKKSWLKRAQVQWNWVQKD